MVSHTAMETSPQNLSELEKKIKIVFKDKSVLQTAFVHKSYINEHKDEKRAHNERLEFLGDAVLELVATEYLFKAFPESGEGELTSFRSALVKGNHLAQVARDLELGNFLFLSKGEERSGGREKNYLLANTLESLIGAIYLDQGFSVAHTFIDKMILANLEDIVEKGLHVDAKSKLQELAQERFGVTPNYRVISDSGPDHNKLFEVGAFIEEDLIGSGTGSSKQKAEQSAAAASLKAKFDVTLFA